MILALPQIPLITISVRHSSDCPHIGNSYYKRCQCRKSLRYFHDGKQRTVSANTRSWALAEDAKRLLEDKFRAADPNKPVGNVSIRAATRPTLEKAVELFLSDKQTQGIDATAYAKHVRELNRMSTFMGNRGRMFPHEIGLDDLTEFRATWIHHYSSSLTRAKVQERLRGFLRYCAESKMIEQIPKLSPIKVTETPTLPLTEEQYERLLSAIPKEFHSPEKAKRVRALILLMRHSGMAIQDSVTLERNQIQWDSKKNTCRVVTSRQKTGTHVSVLLPPDVAAEINAVMELNGHPDYIFWNRIEGKPKAAVDVWERAFRRAFKAAGMAGGHSHQLRDTFAVELLNKGVSLEEVSKLLGHRSIKTTEKSYAPWVKSRQNKLDDAVAGTWKVRA